MAEADKILTIPADLSAQLRACQSESVDLALRYLARPQSIQRGACLLSLPTGAGKSGVIATIAHYAAQQHVLVLCHRRAVCNQLYEDINGRFFEKLGLPGQGASKAAVKAIPDFSTNVIYVTTFQGLLALSPKSLKDLKKNIRLVIVDEGHAEPSPVWRTLVRGLDAHKIIVTATPYRNDLFHFDIDSSSSYIYSFGRAIADKIIRRPAFETLAKEDLEEFVLEFLRSHPDAKCIVKCRTFKEVDDYFRLFTTKVKTLAVHEQYSGVGATNRKANVPAELAGSDFRVLIHQRKLDEGVDIPEAKLLVLSYPLSSGRELVQSVGRVVREFKAIKPMVVEIGDDTNVLRWKNYIAFDNSLGSEHGVNKFLSSLDTACLIRKYLGEFPDFSYQANRFVKKFDFDKFDPDHSLIIPTASICFLKKQTGFDVASAIDVLLMRARVQGELVRQVKSSTGITVVVALVFGRSRFLSDSYFVEPKLEVLLIKEMRDGIVAVFDSRGRSFSNDEELKIGMPVEVNQLFKVMSAGAKLRPKEASSKAIGVARHRAESVVLKGGDLDRIGDQQAHSMYRLSSVACDTLDARGEKSGSYYVGMDAGRVADRKEENFNIVELNQWLDLIDNRFQQNAQPVSNLLDSYARPVSPAQNLQPLSLIFDLSTYPAPLRCTFGEREFVLENDFTYHAYTSGFLLINHEPDTRMDVRLNAEVPHVAFSCAGEAYVDVPGNERQGLPEFLAANTHRILFDEGVTYSGARFYQQKLPTEDGFDVAKSELADVLIGLPELLRKGLSEKGDVDEVIHVNGEEFHATSVFHLVDKLKYATSPGARISSAGPFFRYFPDPDLILCTDMGTEPADFIISSPKRLVYVHVKCGSSAVAPQSSAGALTVVGSQAIKNLEMLVSADKTLQFANLSLLAEPWPSMKAPQRLNDRIRLFKGKQFELQNGQTLEAALQECLDTVSHRRKDFRVKKEAWIIAANSFSIDHFVSQMSKGKKALAESLQAYQLMQSWVRSASSIDSELKIFGSKKRTL